MIERLKRWTTAWAVGGSLWAGSMLGLDTERAQAQVVSPTSTRTWTAPALRAPSRSAMPVTDYRYDRNVEQTQARIPDDVRLKKGTGRPAGDEDEDYFFRVETEPPTRQRLFTIGSETKFLQEIEDEFREADPTQFFLLPAPVDDFNGPNNKSLGPNWFQNRATGSGQDEAGRKGEIQQQNNLAVYPVGAKPEAAVLNETVGSENMSVSVEIVLGSPESEVGIVFRAIKPGDADKADQIKETEFYYALVTATTVRVGHYQDGKPTDLNKASISSQMAFNLAITAYEDQITVFRDGQEILRTVDDRWKGTYSGIGGTKSIGKPTTFDNFVSVRYAGPFQDRQFAPSVSVLKGPNVHYNPLYFEQVTLERYGQHFGNLFQPFVAHALFFGDCVMTPYSIAKSPWWTCQSGEGYAKPGDVVLPFRYYPPVPDPKGILNQAVAMALIFTVVP